VVGKAPRPLGDLRPGEPSVAKYEALVVGAAGGDRLMDLCDRELHDGTVATGVPPAEPRSLQSAT
jgi:hypothetical protein